jgi:hypothetical protein
MRFNYLTKASGFTRITGYVEQLVDGAVKATSKRSLGNCADPPVKCMNRRCELSELMSWANAH